MALLPFLGLFGYAASGQSCMRFHCPASLAPAAGGGNSKALVFLINHQQTTINCHGKPL
jgi:hypothetical protein